MDIALTKKEYEKYVKKKSPKSRTVRNVVRAFIVGGLICVVGQAIANFLRGRDLSQDSVSAVTALVMVFLGALLTGLNVYDELGKFAGAGSIIPITGFANAIVSPAMEYKSEGYVTGLGAKMFLIAGPVLVYGISASVVAGILYFIIRW